MVYGIFLFSLGAFINSAPSLKIFRLQKLMVTVESMISNECGYVYDDMSEWVSE